MRGATRHRLRSRERETSGFTLLELLVAVSIIALLLAVVIPSFATVRHQARSLICMDHLRTACFNFRIFADPYANQGRGESSGLGKRFSAIDFLDNLYDVDEFWTVNDATREWYRPAQEPIMCPAGPRKLARVPDSSCDEGGVDPPGNISYAMNRRLLRVPLGKGTNLHLVNIPERIIDRPNVPLLFDASGQQALLRNANAGGDAILFSAPPGAKRDGYKSGNYWHPGYRHRGKMNIGFVGGHVVSTRDYKSDATWDWEYYPLP